MGALKRTLAVLVAFAVLVGNAWSAFTDFEGIPDLTGIGTAAGMNFGIAWVSLVDSDAGGNGDFGNEPSASTIATLLNTTDLVQSDTRIVFPSPMRRVAFRYSYDNSGGPTTATFYDQNNNLVGSASLDFCGFSGCGAVCSGDPTGMFCAWTSFTFSGSSDIAYMEIDLATALNSFLIDDMTADPSADLSVTKTAAATVVAGGSLSYTITVANGGAGDAGSVVLADTLPAGTRFVSLAQGAGPAFSCTTPAVGATGAVSCSIATLPAGASATFTLVVGVDAAVAAGSTIANTATVSSTPADANAANNAATSSAVVSGSADVSITKSAPASLVAGADATYTLTVVNNGPGDAQTVALTDSLPAGTTFVSLSQGAGPSFTCSTPAVGANGTVSCSRTTLAAGASATFTLVAAVSASTSPGTTVVNTAIVTSTTFDPAPPLNNAASASTTVALAVADISLAKTAAAGSVGPGEAIRYTLTVSNAGPAIAANVVVTDAIPAGTSFVSATPSQGSCSGTATVTCSLGSLASGGTATVSLVLTSPLSLGPFANTASVATTSSDANPGNNASTASVAVALVGAAQIPALSPIGLAVLALGLAIAGAWQRRRR